VMNITYSKRQVGRFRLGVSHLLKNYQKYRVMPISSQYTDSDSNLDAAAEYDRRICHSLLKAKVEDPVEPVWLHYQHNKR